MSIIKIDIKNEKGPINPVWNIGFNTCHCELVLREDLLAHMKMTAHTNGGKKMGSPDYLTQAAINLLMDKANMKQTQKLLFADSNMNLNVNENINPGDVMLIQIGNLF